MPVTWFQPLLEVKSFILQAVLLHACGDLREGAVRVGVWVGRGPKQTHPSEKRGWGLPPGREQVLGEGVGGG